MEAVINLLWQLEHVIVALALLLLAFRALPSGTARMIAKRVALMLISVLLYVALRKDIPLHDLIDLLVKLL